MRISSFVTADDKLKLLTENFNLHNYKFKNQIYLLVKEIFNDLSINEKNKLLKLINEPLVNSKKDKTDNYEVYN